MASIINTGLSALTAFKRQMETTGHNIANVNTEGYSRQRAELVTRLPQQSSAGFAGAGVDLAGIRRSYDDYLAMRVRDYSSSYEESSVYYSRARQIDNVIADQSAGIDGILQNFFAAVNDVADDPTSVEARAVLLNRGTQLADRFNSLDSWFSDIRNRLGQDLEREANEINSQAQSIVEVNQRIGSFNGLGDNIPADVLDERDRLVDQLSRYTNVTSVKQADGTVNVFVGTGQALVLGVNRNQLAVENNPQDPERAELTIQQPGNASVNITQQMSGGSLGGLLRFRDEILDESHNALGRVALGVSSFFNEQHRLGMDLDGELGGDFFSTLNAPDVLHADGLSSNVTATFTNISELSTHDYQLDFIGGDATDLANWRLTDLATGANVAISGTAGNFTASSGDIGFSMSVVNTAAATAGDSYRVRPTRQAASSIGTLISNERDIAAALPLTTSIGAGNTGTAAISGGAVTTRTGTDLSNVPITLTYNNALARFDLSGGLGSVAYDPATNSGDELTVSVPGFGNYSFKLSGTPANGDTFTINDNAAGLGDNRNARSLADLQKANLMIGGTATFANTYGALIADVGTRTEQAETNASVQGNLLGQAESEKSEISGVNLDEEAANLVRFQQAYQAAAQVISIANSLFDSLLGAVRR